MIHFPQVSRPASHKQQSRLLAGLLAGLFVVAAGIAHAQTYRWVDPATGRTMFTDTPPPGSAKQVVRTGKSSNAEGDKSLPYATQLAAKNFPVTLYTGAECTPCNQAKDLLNKRGIPFTEKTLQTQADLAELKALAGESTVPVLKVGRQTLKGFDAGNYDSALNLAGYPKAGSNLAP